MYIYIYRWRRGGREEEERQCVTVEEREGGRKERGEGGREGGREREREREKGRKETKRDNKRNERKKRGKGKTKGTGGTRGRGWMCR
jgi:hypothetical protein